MVAKSVTRHFTKMAYLAVILVLFALVSWRGWAFWQGYQGLDKNLQVKASTPAGQTTVRPVSNLTRLHLFGRLEEKPEPPPQVAEDLPETNLKLTLRGVSAGSEDRQGGALIEGPDKQTNFFRIGQTLPGNALLHSVFANRVVIDRKGKLENLLFPDQWEDSNLIASYTPDDEDSTDDSMQFTGEEPDQSMASGMNPGIQPGSRGSTGPSRDRSTTADQLSENRRQEIKERLQKLRAKIREQRGQ